MLIDRVELKPNTYSKIFDSPAFDLLKIHSEIDENTILYQDDMNNTYHSGFYAIFKEGDTSLYEFSKIKLFFKKRLLTVKGCMFFLFIQANNQTFFFERS